MILAVFFTASLLLCGSFLSKAFSKSLLTPTDTAEIDLPYPFEDAAGSSSEKSSGGMYLNNPSNVKSGFEYDPSTGKYNYSEKIGDRYYKYPSYMDFEEYLEYDSKKSMQDYWKQKSSAEDINQTQGFRPSLTVKSKAFDRLFGGDKIDIRPQGSAELSFGLNRSTQDNPGIAVNQRSNTTFDFDQKIQLNVTGNIGTKLQISTSYNTEATFDFENQTKIKYSLDEGSEDEIIQKIEAGDVSLPLKGSLITGSQTLFGLKTELKFGKLTVTSVISQEKGEKKEVNVQGGAQIQDFEREASNYEENKHYFLSQYFRDQYESALATPPIVNSRINITKIEVWVSNTNSAIENTKNILGFVDLGEGDAARIYNSALVNDVNASPNANYAANEANDLYSNLTGGYSVSDAIRSFVSADRELEALGYVNGNDFEKYENARLLRPSEFTLNPQLGYISLNSSLNAAEILGVSFQYTLNGQVFQVGEFSTDGIEGQDALIVKLLKGTILDVNNPMWDLMMKNVYSLGAFSISPNDFFLDILYLNPETGVEIPFIPESSLTGQPILNLLNLDRLNTVNQPNSDGVFDFIDGVTINASNGRVYFPVLEPFGDHLRSLFNDAQTAEKYVYDSLYHTTQALARQDANKNRFRIKGSYSSSSSSDISLNAINVPRGSVKVTAGGATLTEGVDYTVDYQLGRVKIINDGILQSNTPIKISLESQSLFNIQRKTLLGSRFDYKVNDQFNIGGTFLKLSERPLTRKINIGNEPINNIIWGVDLNYSEEVPLLTQVVDKLPFYSTKAKSTVTVEGEFAHLIPGNPRSITTDGIAYLDDFEGSQSTIDLKTIFQWRLASTPQGQSDLFPEGEGTLSNTLAYGYNRAKLAWYVIDPLFWRDNLNSGMPDHIRDDPDMRSNHYMREVLETEVFPFKSLNNNGIVTNLPIMDLAFYPDERGPYNFDTSGIINNGTNLTNPTTRWGGIMRRIQTTDFESSNIEFIQFWMMDPFDDEDGNVNHSGGDLYFNLGDISEDILKDSRKSFENGMPTSAITPENSNLVDTTIWGRVPTVQALVNAFDNDPSTRPFQDIGMDGLNDADEAAFFGNNFGPDPSADNYHHYRGTDYDNAQLNILDRYKFFNGMEGNSPVSEQETESYSTQATARPDIEDINENNNLDFRESYFQYKIRLTPQDVNEDNIGNNYITDVLTAEVRTPNGETRTVKWYQFKIPLREPEKTIGSIQDFKSIRFMRMFMKGFNEEVVLRFARLDLVRGEWRKYADELLGPGEYIASDDETTVFDISAVNVEENSEKAPVNYIIPPGIDREINPNTANATTINQLNEQSLVLDVCDLNDGNAKAAFKVMNVDIRRYKRLKMFIHAEESDPNFPLNDDDLSLFIRMGTDFDNNYYEYEVPMKVTPAGNYNTDNNNNATDREIVWPLANDIDLAFSELKNLKIKRNSLLLNPLNGVQVSAPYEESEGDRKLRIKGNPNLANVRMFMIGIRNPKQDPFTGDDDGLPKCAEIWVNELRMAEFDNEGGWAARMSMTAQIADLGNVTVAGSHSTPGFGSIEQKLNERQLETRSQYDLSTGIELGKIVPEAVGVSVPMYYGVTEGTVTPKFNPLDPDLEMNELLANETLTATFKDSIKRLTVERSKRRNITFTNVRKLPAKEKKKTRFYDLSNFSFNYGYSEDLYKDFEIEFDTERNYKGGINYAFNSRAKNHAPFGKAKFAKAKTLKWLKDFNFYLLPKQLSFQTNVDRMYSERRNRNNTGFDYDLPTYYQKHFYWNRIYNLKYDLTKTLKFDFTATNNATINEPLTANGRVDQNFTEEYNQWRDTVIQSFRDFGINTQYHHNFNINYTIPISKLPYLSFITLKTKYSGDYDWKRAPIGADSLGHTIQNSNTLAITPQLNMSKLYNEIGFLKKVQKRQKDRARRKAQRNKKPNPRKSEAENAKLLGWKMGTPPEDIKFELKEFKNSDTTKVEMWRKKDPFRPLDPFWILAMSPKNISGSYTKSRGTLLPGYNQESNILGSNPNFSAPGFNFISGIQEDDFATNAATNDWLSPNSPLLYNYTTSYVENYSLKATLRPIKTLRISLSASHNYSIGSTQQFFRPDEFFVDTLGGTQQGEYYFPVPLETGNLSMSYAAINTSFIKDNDDRSSDAFKDFLEQRFIISQRLGALNDSSNGVTEDGFSDGYNGISQEVLIPAFIATYAGRDAEKVSLGSIAKYLPLPNWRVTYDGLSKLPLFKLVFKKVNLSHSYKTTLNINTFTTNLLHKDPSGNINRDINNNFIPEHQISTILINENFSPLLGVDVTLVNNLSFRLQHGKSRSLSLSLTNTQLTEIKGTEWTIGTGYKFKKVKMPFVKRTIKSDLDTRIDIAIRNDNTIIRQVVGEINQLTAGQRFVSVKFTANYDISKKVTLRAFYDFTSTKPSISTAFPTSNANGGVSLRFTLSQ